jgi:hypothetical protein
MIQATVPLLDFISIFYVPEINFVTTHMSIVVCRRFQRYTSQSSWYSVGNFSDTPHNLLYPFSSRVFTFCGNRNMYHGVQVHVQSIQLLVQLVVGSAQHVNLLFCFSFTLCYFRFLSLKICCCLNKVIS